MNSMTFHPRLLAISGALSLLAAACATTRPPSTPTTAAPAAAVTAGPQQAPAATPAPPPPPPPAVMPRPVTPLVSTVAPAPDPRTALTPGRWDAGEAAWNMRMISTTPPTVKTLAAMHSDLAFSGKYAIQGNYNGFELYDISDPARPVLAQSYL